MTYSDKFSCCDYVEGDTCYCSQPQFDANKFFYGDCNCQCMVSLSVVYLRGPKAKLIMLYDTNDEKNVRCKYSNIMAGEELMCLSGYNKFTESTSYKIIYDDNTECMGLFDTSCSRNIVGTKGVGCGDLVVTGFVDKNGKICEDGLKPCSCDNSPVPPPKKPSLMPKS